MKNLTKLALTFSFGALIFGLNSCGDKEKEIKEKNEEALTIYIATEDTIFNDLISQYKEDLSKKREYKIELNETYNVSKMTKENNKLNIEGVYENELKSIEMFVKLKEANKKRYLNGLDGRQQTK